MSTKLTKEQWIEILRDGEISKFEDIKLLNAIYSCEGCKTFHRHFKKMKLQDPRISIDYYANRIISKYSTKYNIELKSEGIRGKGQWWLFFDGWFEDGSWVWALKPNLIKAIEDMENETKENINVANWINLLNDKFIFTDEVKNMLRYIYCCPNQKASFTDIAESFGTSHQKISNLNVKIAKNILKNLKREPPVNNEGKAFYYNIIFTDFKKNDRGHWVVAITPNLIKAIEEVKYFDDSFVAIDNSDTDELESIFYNDGEEEGKKIQYLTIKYERNPKNRDDAIRIHGLSCCICDFNFENIYGEIGKNFIEVHHCVPLYSKDEVVNIKPAIDLVCVCSNCHRMLHRKRDYILNPAELKTILKKK